MVSNRGTSSFISTVKRHSTNGKLSPGPCDYKSNAIDHEFPRNTKGAFGSVTKRTLLINRDIQRSPFNDPTSAEGPAPGQYRVSGEQAAKQTLSPNDDLKKGGGGGV